MGLERTSSAIHQASYTVDKPQIMNPTCHQRTLAKGRSNAMAQRGMRRGERPGDRLSNSMPNQCEMRFKKITSLGLVLTVKVR